MLKMQETVLATRTGWHVHNVVCGAGPADASFEETHETVAIALVVEGTFQYRTRQGSALMAPGAIMLGNHGARFECGHEHGVGDHCISFHYRPGFWEELVAAVPGARRTTFSASRLAPVRSLVPLTQTIRMASELRRGALETVAFDIAATVLNVDGDRSGSARPASPRDQRLASEAVRMINESVADIESDALTLTALSAALGMNVYHFLRTFRQVVGSTPHQYLIRQRMHRAAERLITSRDPVSEIVFDAGFGDLSTFNRQFKAVFGVTPRRYRQNWRVFRDAPKPGAGSPI